MTQKKIWISGLTLTATALHEHSNFLSFISFSSMVCGSFHHQLNWLADLFFFRLFWCGNHCCFSSSPTLNLSLSPQPQQQCPTVLFAFKNYAKTEDEQEWQKRFGPSIAMEVPILNVSWGIVDKGTVLPLLSWTTPVKEVVHTPAYVTVRPKEVSEVQTGEWPHLPHLLTCSLTPFSPWH